MKHIPNITIAFSGPDGSGKSTIAKKVAKRWNPSRIYWLRGTHTFAYLLARMLTSLNRFTGDTPFYLNLSIPAPMKKLWQLIEFFSLLPHVFALKLRGLWYPIVCDRYLPDFVVWVALLTGDPHYLSTLQFQILRGLASSEAILFYFTASIPELEKRSGEHTLFLKKQLMLYEKVRKYLPGDVIDTTNTNVEEVFHYVHKKILLKAKAS